MPLHSSYSTTPFDLAKRLLGEAKSSGQDLNFLPFGRYDAEETHTCWLSPTHENPAYWRGKIVCSNQATNPDTFVGYYVEKGYGAAAAPMLRSAQSKMKLTTIGYGPNSTHLRQPKRTLTGSQPSFVTTPVRLST
jgi:hypothetical protein